MHRAVGGMLHLTHAPERKNYHRQHQHNNHCKPKRQAHPYLHIGKHCSTPPLLVSAFNTIVSLFVLAIHNENSRALEPFKRFVQFTCRALFQLHPFGTDRGLCFYGMLFVTVCLAMIYMPDLWPVTRL